MIKFLIDCLLKPKQTINSNMLNKYSFLRLNVIFFILFLLISFAHVNINIYKDEKFELIAFIIIAFFQQIVIYLFLYLPIIIIGVCSIFLKDKCYTFTELKRYAFPFFAIMAFIVMVLTTFVEPFYTGPKILLLALFLIAKLYPCYPLYLILSKHNLQRNNTYIVLAIYILCVLTNLI